MGTDRDLSPVSHSSHNALLSSRILHSGWLRAVKKPRKLESAPEYSTILNMVQNKAPGPGSPLFPSMHCSQSQAAATRHTWVIRAHGASSGKTTTIILCHTSPIFLRGTLAPSLYEQQQPESKSSSARGNVTPCHVLGGFAETSVVSSPINVSDSNHLRTNHKLCKRYEWWTEHALVSAIPLTEPKCLCRS